MRRISALALACLMAFAITSQSADDTKPALPKVVIMGDSIRLGYTATVVKKLEGKAVVVSPKNNGQDSSNVLKHLDEWVIKEKPDVVHFNCGIHDTKKDKKAGTFQVPPDQYEKNLRKIVQRIRKETGATVLFATTTPIIDDRAAKVREKYSYELLDASIQQYNGIALKVMKELNVPVDDLRAVVYDERDKLMLDDGTHFSEPGRAKLGVAVAYFIGQHLSKKP
jgi:lysophospholipase L1-like esterase